ncbi:MAG: Ig-like domain-containing protein [Bacteroidota bacterium]
MNSINRSSLKLFLLSFTLLLFNSTQAATEKYRLTYRDDPSTTITIGWVQTSGTNPVVYYGDVDHGTDTSLYSLQKTVDRTENHQNMDHYFARLTGLTPNTAYYFVINDSEGPSPRFWFKTISNDPNDTLSIIAGGDSRSDTPLIGDPDCRERRQKGNKMVSKLRPHFVIFDGDFIFIDYIINGLWEDWFDDWQLTTGSDGRMIPIVVSQGNHESAEDLDKMFDTPSSDAYYVLIFGGDLLRFYTLNNEIDVSVGSPQTNWLTSDLAANYSNFEWLVAQYHEPMRVHNDYHTNRDDIADNWAPLFETYNVRLVVEGHTHSVKTTWPIIRTDGPGNDNGFLRDDTAGVVYIGEGTWGAPLRDANVSYSWTRNSGGFTQFKWIFICKQRIEIRTVKFENVDNVGQVSDDNMFTPPGNIDIWASGNGSVVIIQNPDIIAPTVEITYPYDGNFINSSQNFAISSDASDANGTITKVEFFVDDTLAVTDYDSPFQIIHSLSSTGTYSLTAKATDNDGYNNTSEPVYVHVGNVNIILQVNASSNDAEENIEDGSVDITSSDLELIHDDYIPYIDEYDQKVGIRFTNLQLLQGAEIINAYIQFTSEGSYNDNTNLVIHGEDSDNSLAFQGVDYNISSRTLTTANILWGPPAWNGAGDAGQDQQTPDLSTIVQEIVDRTGWLGSSALSIIISGSGTRTAVSYDGDPADAPVLHIEYTMESIPDLELDVKEIAMEDIILISKIYPNPTNDNVLNIEFVNTNTPVKIEVIDILDRICISVELENIKTGIYELNISGLQPGSYFLNARTENIFEVREIVVY